MTKLNRDIDLRRPVLPLVLGHEPLDDVPVPAVDEALRRRAVVALVHAVGRAAQEGEEPVAPAAAVGGLDRGRAVAC